VADCIANRSCKAISMGNLFFIESKINEKDKHLIKYRKLKLTCDE
jgi:hypothetical protein